MRTETVTLTGWQKQYLTATHAYPIATCEAQIVPLLRDPFCRAVVYRNPDFAFDASQVIPVDDKSLASRYWHDENAPRKRLASGRVVHFSDVTEKDILSESIAAGIVIPSEAARTFTARCNQLRSMFLRVFSAYTNTENVEQRGFTLFTPKGGRGRSPELHIDNTVLTLHWSAALATFRIHDGELPDEVWNDLSMLKRKQLDPERDREQLDAIFRYLTGLAETLEMTENRIGDVMITKGQRGKDLDDREVRESVCVHVSSPSIIQNGQAGFLMTPRM